MVFNGPQPMQKEKIKKLLYFLRNCHFKNVSILKISKKSQFLAPSSEPHWGPLGMGGPNRDSHWDTLGHGVILSIPIGTPLVTVSFYQFPLGHPWTRCHFTNSHLDTLGHGVIFIFRSFFSDFWILMDFQKKFRHLREQPATVPSRVYL